MSILADIPVLQRGNHQLTVVNTDLFEAEALIKGMAEKEQQADPDVFAGLSPCVYFKMPYIPPCDTFNELRKLILRIRENTGLRAEFRGVVAIEVTQWVGHEQEEYFTVLLKYLYDHRDIWSASMILNDCKQTLVQRFLCACARYITPKLLEVKVFADTEVLCTTVQNEFKRRDACISHAAAQMLAKAMVHPALKEARSMTLIERTVDEILSCIDDKPEVSADQVRGYLMDTCSTINMMAGRLLYDERSMRLEKEGLQLRG